VLLFLIWHCYSQGYNRNVCKLNFKRR
jgi:hypothetical protein